MSRPLDPERRHAVMDLLLRLWQGQCVPTGVHTHMMARTPNNHHHGGHRTGTAPKESASAMCLSLSSVQP